VDKFTKTWFIHRPLPRENVTYAKRKPNINYLELSLKYPLAMLKGQFVCPKCGKKGLIFHGTEDWLWFHYNGNDENPKASFCNVGKTLPEKFMLLPFAIEPQLQAFWLRATDRPIKKDGITMWTYH